MLFTKYIYNSKLNIRIALAVVNEIFVALRVADKKQHLNTVGLIISTREISTACNSAAV